MTNNPNFSKMLWEIRRLKDERKLSVTTETSDDKRTKIVHYEGNGRVYRVSYFDKKPIEIYYKIEGQVEGHLYE